MWLEITKEIEMDGYLVDQIIKRTDLGFISSGEKRYFFSPENNISVNAKRFVCEFDPYSIAMTTDLFHTEACKEIDPPCGLDKY